MWWLLQLLGNLFEYFLSKKRGADAKLTVLGATSGDTGAAQQKGPRLESPSDFQFW